MKVVSWIVVVNLDGLTEDCVSFTSEENADEYKEMLERQYLGNPRIATVTVHEVDIKIDDSDVAEYACSDLGLVDPDNPPERQ